MKLRITGLVHFFNQVRTKLQAGLAPGEVEEFVRQVQTACRQVEQICAQHKTTPSQLPAPSRRAYEFLKNLDLTRLPLRDEHEPAAQPQQGTLRISNLSKSIEQLMVHTWLQVWRTELPKPDEVQLRKQLEFCRDNVEEILAHQGFGAEAMTEASRRSYDWLRFILSEDHLQAHLTALDRAARAARPFIHSKNKALALNLMLMNIRPAWRYSKKLNRLTMTCSEGFLYAPKEVWTALFGMVLSRKTTFRQQIVKEYIASEEFSAVLFEMEASGAEDELQTEGHAHSLNESFDRVNRNYFNGAMPKPTLHWNRVLTTRKFGHYMPSRDTVMISITLDNPGVPAYVVDYVMYHELLHKKHGVKIVQGKRLSHTPEFREDEKRFVQFQEANLFLKDLVRKMG